MKIEQKYLDIYIESDGSISKRNTVNIFQYTNDCNGVRLFCPYSPGEVMVYISVELYNGTVLDERTMGYREENGEWHSYTYLFPDTVTSLCGMKYSTSIYLAFRFEDISSNATQSCLTSAKVPVTVQPSLMGRAASVSDSEAADLQKQINELVIAVSKDLEPATEETLGGIKVGESLSILKDGMLSVDIARQSSPLKIALDDKVPKALDILSRVTDAELKDPDVREDSRIYTDRGGTPSYVTVEQLKDMNTKILCAENVGDVRILSLSNGDFVFLKKE